MSCIRISIRRHIIFCVLFSLTAATPLLVFGQASASAAQTAKAKAKIEKVGIRGDITIDLHNGKTYHGFVKRIDADSFEMTEIRSSAFNAKNCLKLSNWRANRILLNYF